MRTKIFTGLLMAAFLCVAAGASVAYYHTGGDPSQAFNSDQIKLLLRPPSLPMLDVAAAIQSSNPANLRYYFSDARLMWHGALALTGLFCCAMAFLRVAKLARADSAAAMKPTRRPQAMNIAGLSVGTQKLQWEPRHGLKSRLTRWFGAIAVLLSAASFLMVYWSLSPLLRRHGIERGRDIANSVAAAVTPQLVNGDTTQLRQTLLNHVSRNNLAYILVFDASQTPLAYAGPEVGDPADAVRTGLTVDAQGQRMSHFRNQVAYDMLARVDNGQLGTVQVGVWRARIEDQARKVLLVIAVLFVALTYGVILAARRLFAKIARPLEDLAASAEALSRGDLATPIVIPPAGPMAQLGAALERVRTALQPAINRLKAELDVPARFTIMGAMMHDAWEGRDDKSGNRK